MIRIERHDHWAEIVLDRPEKRNALTPEMLQQMVSSVNVLQSETEIRAVVLRGEGRVFCAGFDLKMCVGAPDVLRELLTGLSHAVRALRRARFPVVAAAHGAAIAGGCALLGGADLVVADQSAKLGYPVVTLGISPAVSAPSLELLIGGGAMRSRLLDPGLVSGVRAAELGLVHMYVDIPEDAVARAQVIAMRFAEKSPEALEATKRWLNTIDGSASDKGFDAALHASLSLVGNEEEQSRLAALFDSLGRS